MTEQPNYEEDLLADLQSGSEDELDLKETEKSVSDVPQTAFNGENWQDLLSASHLHNVGHKLEQLDVANVKDPDELTSVRRLIPQIREQLKTYSNEHETDYMELLASVNDENQSEEFKFLMSLSELPTVIHDEISLLHRFVRTQYRVVFGELESLVPSPVDYCRVVLLVGQELSDIRSKEPELQKIVSNAKVLAISMGALENFTRSFYLNDADMLYIKKACKIAIELSEFIKEVSDFVSSKLSKFAPNVNNLVGAVVTSQLLISVGSLRQLALTPACNLPSFGVKDLSSQLKRRSNFVRATGYLFYSDLVVGLPPEVINQALRIISGKIVLAARIDLSGSKPDGSLGSAYLQEVKQKIDKLLTPPDRAAPKALPAPKEQKANRNTDARLSKAMVNRLNQQKEKSNDLDTIVFARDDEEAEKNDKSKRERSSWFSGIKRNRFADLDSDEEDTKRQKS
ncbi:uncharacterized protein CXQ87_000630 [Candidozyma duobushaemuli]|uniref:Nop domain-containing protein n=1 Tax=Candidozyma duobushaemuli TaxID=1231522 RepID=A0A2V1AJK9_9ASCO|nr:uncharacterized protein CXQ87_000630 [[Candida] duobushaemulonis]PVH17736.1 hypothetical protein CXQ87_000630 [[Candida] duobushaemulonis]